MNQMKIFNEYISKLGLGVFNGIKYSDLDVWAIIKPLEFSQDIKKLDDKTILEKVYKKTNEIYDNVRQIKNFKLLNVNEKTFNKDTLEDSEHTYQEMRDENIQNYIFDDDKETYSKYSQVKNSIDYEYLKNDEANRNTQNPKYNAFISDFDISKSGYRKSDFTRLNVKEDQIIESEVTVNADDFVYTENNSSDKILNHGIYGFLLTITKRNYNLQPRYQLQTTPVMIYLFDKPTYSNYNKFKLVFNANGLFGVV